MEKKLFKIGDVAGMLATSVRTIRYYEEESLVSPIRTGGGTRLYTPAHVGRLQVILHLAQSGCSLESIRAICSVRETCKTGDEGSEKVTGLLREAQTRLEEQIRMLGDMTQELAVAREVILGCRGCNNVPSSSGCPECPVRKKLAENEILSLVWDHTDALYSG
uniref:DNA-binding transcriptional regulator, MerR family n=1 Tax=Candidatus Kentrum sp. UNK TaxID=2126344 RepID=A0A451AYX5_9GAMM|nr:MAG: DNA-binding transcriptional regulator, MerR family [Candidatus Kentron sp. UNK]VFK71127.1 MAG: DNA-binding transcriptional regulator, MerR family [Candidatus Kentron sp. UNK]